MIEHLRAQGIVLYATNTGSLYPAHLALARNQATTAQWWMHVRNAVLPAYRREMGLAISLPADIIEAAADLRDYYTRHIREF